MASYQIIGTKEPYNGKVIKIGDLFYTTQGGGIEGDRQQVEVLEAPSTSTSVITNNNLDGGQPIPSDTNRDVVTTFVTGDNSNFGRNTYYYSNGSIVPSGTPLHHHTIPAAGDNNFMTTHDMSAGGAVSVFLTPQSNTRRTNQRTRRTNQQTNRTGGAPSGGVRRTGNTGGMGGTGGGGSSY